MKVSIENTTKLDFNGFDINELSRYLLDLVYLKNKGPQFLLDIDREYELVKPEDILNRQKELDRTLSSRIENIKKVVESFSILGNTVTFDVEEEFKPFLLSVFDLLGCKVSEKLPSKNPNQNLYSWLHVYAFMEREFDGIRSI